MNTVSFSKNQVTVNGVAVDFDFHIEQVLEMNDVIVVLLDPDSNLCKWGQYPNLFGVSLEGDVLWKCELPTSDTGDCYLSFKKENQRIIVYSWSSFDCVIDPTSGKIISKVFVK